MEKSESELEVAGLCGLPDLALFADGLLTSVGDGIGDGIETGKAGQNSARAGSSSS